ncbi:glycerate kinase [Thermocatellispora tengchongensis]|uniref:Glycerate kinase n=1 Tax=Thermocatellispora tengchongensis TaxID=1073253 RepID=A0A840P305_9ACTN|nr:glycerate kinase [Thermocatellispora tengchongensis]MBB5131627.1 glycerate kinase [Thermocatellispora tengchongensis]
MAETSGRNGHVVIAPDKFKGSLSATQVARRVAAGLGPEVRSVCLPVADGGDGTVDAVVAFGYSRIEAEVTGPTGERITAAYAWHPGDGEAPPTAVVELAEASGLRRLPPAEAGPGQAAVPGAHEGVRLAPLTATSRGTGDLIAAAVRRGARRVVLGLGGSACTDGGTGMMAALGVRFLDAEGAELPPGGGALTSLAAIDTAGLLPELAGVEFVVASDVDNPLLGPHGAAAVYGPQKGATSEDVRVLEAGLARLAAVAAHTHGLVGAAEHDGIVRSMGVAAEPGAGAAGGVGFAALAFLRAQVRPGIEYLLELLGFAEHLEGARLVITGEGALDEQTLRGKAPAGVAARAVKAGVPVVAVCGRRTLGDEELRAAGIVAAYALTDIEPDTARCIAEAGPLLERLVAERVRGAHAV